jgi:hypothetical protein
MSAAYDPAVARALDGLVPTVDSDPEKTLRHARAAAQGLERRRAARLRRTAIVAFAALVLLSGAALAADHFDVFPWVDQSSRSTATFSIDSSRTYRGPAAQVLVCPQAGAGSFACSIGAFNSNHRRAYSLAERVAAQPQITRESMLQGLAATEKNGQVDHAAAERMRRDLAAVGDDFFAGLSLLTGVETIAGGDQAAAPPGFERVPPAGVPMWIACEASGSGFRCHNLASSRGVAVGTPLYFLRASSDWVLARKRSPRPINVRLLFSAVFGRELTPAETRLLVDFSTLAVSGEGESQGGRGHAQPAPSNSSSP